MTKKRPLRNADPEQHLQVNDNFQDALRSYSEALAENNSVQRSTAASVGRTFVNWDTNISVESSYHRGDYEYFRHNETVPRKHEDIIDVCDRAYEEIGIIKNVIDTMSEFTISGIRFQHPDKGVENVYNTWFRKISCVGCQGGHAISERFVNNLYRHGNVIVKRALGTLRKQDVKNWRQSKGKQGDTVKLEKIKALKRQLPLRYFFYYPGMIDVVNKQEAILTGEYKFGIKIPGNLRRNATDYSGISVTHRSGNKSALMHHAAPSDLKRAITKGDRFLTLDQNTITVWYYKKDDWNLWAKPILYAVIKDLMMYEKLKLADVSALDGVISNVRLWQLGIYNESNPVHSILPTRTGINKLRNILANNVGGGVLDLVWGPELDFKESATGAWQWLGSEKYGPTMDAIYDGLGIPPSLRSLSTNRGNIAGNLIGIQTMIERLEYGRQVLIEFWMGEVRRVHKALGYTSRLPKLVFDQMILADRAAEKQLLINLADRDIISYETLLEVFGREPTIEEARIKRESNRRGEQMPEKASPFHNPDKEHDLYKILLQGGSVTPSQVGLELEENHDGESNKIEQMGNIQEKIAKQRSQTSKFSKTGEVNEGRPRNVKETQKRKPKQLEKSTTANFDVFGNVCLWAQTAYEKINEIVMPALLHTFDKSNARSLSKKEIATCEQIKFGILCNLAPYTEITAQVVYDQLKIVPQPDKDVMSVVQLLAQKFYSVYNRDPKLDEIRQIYAMSYAINQLGEE
jgi:hypothetical protein